MIGFCYTKNVMGIPIRSGCRVTRYFEDANGIVVVLERGEKISRDGNVGSFASWIGQELHFLVAVVQDDKDIS